MRTLSGRLGVSVLLISALVLSLVTALTPATRASAQTAVPHVQGTRTVPVYDYADAIRESVDVESTLDSDGDGAPDTVRVDIIRPREAAEAGVDVPVIMVASPYYQCCGRGHESERKEYGEDGRVTKYPLFYDNYFVPRGYAVALVDLMGTANSTGCMDVGGPAEVGSAVAAIDWLNGRATATDLQGDAVEADWTDGQVGMIGKSWDGSVANGAAATGVEGLETIVPISAISSWYDYMRQNGTLQSRGYWNFLHGYVNERPDEACAALREHAIEAADDVTGVYNDFWAERDYVPDADQVTASVFVVHGIGDGNVDTLNVGPWWEALGDAGVERKIWLYQTGHEEPFDVRRAEWVDTIHRWFDHTLQDLDNGIADEPMATIESEPGVWVDEDAWPARGNRLVRFHLSGPADDGEGSLALLGARQRATESVGSGRFDELTWSTDELTGDVRLSGTPMMHIRFQVDRPTTALELTLFESGDVRVADSGVDEYDTESCWGASTDADDACYIDTYVDVDEDDDTKQLSFVEASAAHWQGVDTFSPLEPGRWYEMSFPLNTTDAFVSAGNRLGLSLELGSPGYTGASSSGATLTVDYLRSYVELPISGRINGLAQHRPRPSVQAPERRERPLSELVREFR